MSKIMKKPLENNTAERELIRYLRLAIELDKPITMFSEYIDEVWHHLLDNPIKYEQWCSTHLGKTVGHIPSGTAKCIVKIDWISAYESRYGNLPMEWFADKSGNIDEPLLENYKSGKTVYASWNCGPAVNSPGSKSGDAPNLPK